MLRVWQRRFDAGLFQPSSFSRRSARAAFRSQFLCRRHCGCRQRSQGSISFFRAFYNAGRDMPPGSVVLTSLCQQFARSFQSDLCSLKSCDQNFQKSYQPPTTQTPSSDLRSIAADCLFAIGTVGSVCPIANGPSSAIITKSQRKGFELLEADMISESLDRRTFNEHRSLWNERANCWRREVENYRARRHIATRIIKCAEKGNRTLGTLTAAAMAPAQRLRSKRGPGTATTEAGRLKQAGVRNLRCQTRSIPG